MFESNLIPTNVHDFEQQIEAFIRIWATLPGSDGDLHGEELQELHDNLQQRLTSDEADPSKDIFQLLVEQSQQGLAVIQNFELVYANPILPEITGYTLEEMKAFTYGIITTALRPDDIAGAWVRLVGYIADGILSPRLEFCFPHKDGTARWAETHADSVMVGDKPTVLATFIDITERKEAELELQQMYAKLELRVRERAEALATANGALQAEIMERKLAEQALKQAHDGLEMRVQQRTEELANVNKALQHEITERLQAEEALKRSEELFRSLSENASDIISVIGGDGTFRYTSPSIKRSLGYGPEELIGHNVFNYVHPDDLSRLTMIFQEAISTSGSISSAEFRLRHKDGSWRILESIGKNLLENSVVDGLVVNSRDVTQRKRIEDEKARLLEKVQQQHEQLRALALRRRNLAQQVVRAQEEERHRVSRELHDEAGQALTALKVSLEVILSSLSPTNGVTVQTNGQLRQSLTKALDLCESTSAQIRSLAHALRPAALDDLGLDLALEGFCRDFAERTNMSISYTGEDIATLSDAAGICFYRFLQEGLTNVARHACAQQVQVALCHNVKGVTLSIKDDGKGFEVRPELFHAGPTQGIGLLGMMERLESLGGQLEITSYLGLGTQIKAILHWQLEN
jgi:PAS domain S-box-containing protein